ncbi:DRTGG domain-containing protein [Peptococcaceae bacterium]|nr:DRTGG domain-containing protein [Peptococcaceae bacterium]
MKNLYITGTAGSAKTIMALGLALKFKEEGMRVSYFKPVGITTSTSVTEDDDGILMKEVLGMKQPLDTIVPFITSPFYLTKFRQFGNPEDRIVSAFEDVSKDADLVLIDGAIFPHAMASKNLDVISLSKQFNASILYMVKSENDFNLDQAIFFNRHFKCQGIDLIGNVFYNVPRQVLGKVEGIYKKILKDNGFQVLGVVPQQTELTAPTAEEFYQKLGGEILTGEGKLNKPIEDVIVGAMSVESALSYLHRSSNTAVVIGGDRADLALAALETNVNLLILTGGLYPNIKVLARAEEKGIPVILVLYDTFTTVERMTTVSNRIKPENKSAIKAALESINEYVDWKYIIEKLDQKQVVKNENTDSQR